MHTVIFRDVRLKGWRPAGDCLETDSQTPLDWVFYHIKKRAADHKPENLRVKFMCHGLPGYLQFANGGYTHPEKPDGNGINYTVLDQFNEINGQLAVLELRSCVVSRIGTCPEIEEIGYKTIFNGPEFCCRLAIAIGAKVKASWDVQHYWQGTDGSRAIRFGGWSGLVFNYGTDGLIKSHEFYPRLAYEDTSPPDTN